MLLLGFCLTYSLKGLKLFSFFFIFGHGHGADLFFGEGFFELVVVDSELNFFAVLEALQPRRRFFLSPALEGRVRPKSKAHHQQDGRDCVRRVNDGLLERQ